MKFRNIISLCDGMSCAQLALHGLGISYFNYYASEIDPYAIKQTQSMFPNTKQIGDISFLNFALYAKEKNNYSSIRATWLSFFKHCPERIETLDLIESIDLSTIDFVFAGTPCQGFSVAGKMQKFKDPRSKLFFDFVDILNLIKKKNPKVDYLVENVRLTKDVEDIFNKNIGSRPIRINSNFFVPQNRDRNYWVSNTRQIDLFGLPVPNIPIPENKGGSLVDILQDESEVDEKHYIKKVVVSDKQFSFISEKFGFVCVDGVLKPRYRSNCIGASYHKGMDNHGQRTVILQLSRGKNKGGVFTENSPTVSANAWEQNNLLMVGSVNKNGFSMETRDIPQGKRVYSVAGKSVTIQANGGGFDTGTGLYLVDARIRRLTPRECARLQGVPEWVQFVCSDPQTYKMLGNGWTIQPIMYLVENILK